MFLVQIDPDTGLVSELPGCDGWKAIKTFNDLFKKKGIKAFTVVALACDYLSPIEYYSDRDRPFRACEEVYGRRNALDFDTEIVKAAKESYLELQKDPDLEMRRINREIKTRLLDRLSAANNEEDDQAIEKLRKSLQSHETSIRSFEDKFDIKVAIGRAITTNGYELSRIENDIKSRKNSKFVQHGENAFNPNKLGLNSKT